MMDSKDKGACVQAMIDAGRLFHQRGWVPASGGNFSARLDRETVVITASGQHKGELADDHFLVADLEGRPLEPGRKASYETGLHMQVYRAHPEVGSVLHTHSIANTVLSRRYPEVALHGFELQKVLPGQPDPATTVTLPVFENDQNIERLAAAVDTHMRAHPDMVAYLIDGHGLYAWGATVLQARYAVEALEFMLECRLRELS